MYNLKVGFDSLSWPDDVIKVSVGTSIDLRSMFLHRARESKTALVTDYLVTFYTNNLVVDPVFSTRSEAHNAAMT
jgi:hypothetical protein